MYKRYRLTSIIKHGIYFIKFLFAYHENEDIIKSVS